MLPSPVSTSTKVAIDGEGAAVPPEAVTEYFRWWYVDEGTGRRRRSRHHMTVEEAQTRWPGATPALKTRIVRPDGLNAGRERFVIKWVNNRSGT